MVKAVGETTAFDAKPTFESNIRRLTAHSQLGRYRNLLKSIELIVASKQTEKQKV